MIEIISSSESSRLTTKLQQISDRNVALDAELMSRVAALIQDVRLRGDAALIDYTLQFDGCVIQPSDLRINEEILRKLAASVDPSILSALREAIKRIRFFHEFERQESWEIKNSDGVQLGQRITPIESAGLYVPGGKASYPSSVIMNVIPAQVAGVDRIVVATPPRALNENPAVAAALVELGVTEVYAVGGAQAIAALAYGTETIPRVDKITGPGNKYVSAAKKLVFGVVGIDSIAGPTEVVVLADDTANASYVASDLLAQSEHSEDASAILITTSERLASEVASEVRNQIESLPRIKVIEQSLARYGAIIVVDSMDEACTLVNEIAPEHLEIACGNENEIASRIRHAGAIFFGDQTPEATGDYLAGPNHVLPTSRAARFSSALGVYDFVKRTSILRFTENELRQTASTIATLARAEGLEAHARSALKRLEGPGSAGILPASVLARRTDAGRPALPERSANMSEPLRNIKPRVREIKPYSLRLEPARIKLNQNENPWDMPAEIKQETFNRLQQRAWSRYPAFLASSLIERLSEFSGWTPDGTLAGNGSNELIQALLMVTVSEGKRVLISEPTFALYRQITTVLGGEIISVPLSPELSYDIEALKTAIETFRPDVTICCSPNNPTGCVISEADLISLLELSGGLIAVDEAYFEFCGQTATALLKQHKNLVVLRTFSKALAMAALRVGYLLTTPELAREISKALLPYHINVFSQTAAEVALEMYESKLKPLVARILTERVRVTEELRRIPGLAPVPSRANFMIVRSEIEPRRVFEHLLQRGILIRDVASYPMLRDYFRVCVGTPAENDILLESLRELFAA